MDGGWLRVFAAFGIARWAVMALCVAAEVGWRVAGVVVRHHKRGRGRRERQRIEAESGERDGKRG